MTRPSGAGLALAAASRQARGGAHLCCGSLHGLVLGRSGARLQRAALRPAAGRQAGARGQAAGRRRPAAAPSAPRHGPTPGLRRTWLAAAAVRGGRARTGWAGPAQGEQRSRSGRCVECLLARRAPAPRRTAASTPPSPTLAGRAAGAPVAPAASPMVAWCILGRCACRHTGLESRCEERQRRHAGEVEQWWTCVAGAILQLDKTFDSGSTHAAAPPPVILDHTRVAGRAGGPLERWLVPPPSVQVARLAVPSAGQLGPCGLKVAGLMPAAGKLGGPCAIF